LKTNGAKPASFLIFKTRNAARARPRQDERGQVSCKVSRQFLSSDATRLRNSMKPSSRSYSTAASPAVRMHATVLSYRFQLNPLAQWCASHALDLDKLTEDDVRSFLAHRQEEVSQVTLATACVRLKTFFAWCEQQGIAEDVARRIRRVKVQDPYAFEWSNPLPFGPVRRSPVSETQRSSDSSLTASLVLSSGKTSYEDLGFQLASNAFVKSRGS